MKIIRDNPVFFLAFGIWLVWGGIWLLAHQTGDAIFFWSAHRSTLTDWLFTQGTRLGEGIAFFAVILLSLFIRYRHAVLVTITGLTVMGASAISKSFFEHERPAAYLRRIGVFDELHLVEGVDLHSGLTSFPSGHTMAAFALFGLLALLAPQKRLLGLIFFLLALLVGLSRIYLVQHFMKDVYAGSMLGVFIAILAYRLQQGFPIHTPAWYNRRLRRQA
jgi:membrane-associated phospholipid phosphatase